MTEFLIPRPAATLALLRDGEHGPEVLMMRRSHLAEFASGAYVFPGVAVIDPGPAIDGHVDAIVFAAVCPPEGDMRAYFDSLRALLAEDVAHVAPGHGFIMDKLPEVVDRLLLHRRDRENKVLRALRTLGPATVEELVPTVYDDTPPVRHGIAARSLLAHLVKLESEGRAGRASDERWAATDS